MKHEQFVQHMAQRNTELIHNVCIAVIYLCIFNHKNYTKAPALNGVLHFKNNPEIPIMWELWVFYLLSSSSSPVELVSSHIPKSYSSSHCSGTCLSPCDSAPTELSFTALSTPQSHLGNLYSPLLGVADINAFWESAPQRARGLALADLRMLRT